MSRDAAGVLLVAYSGRVLLARRAPHVNNGGTWSTFGGRLEPGESPREAAVRELREESGLDYDADDLLELHVRPRGSRDGEYTTFLLLVMKEVRPRLNNENDDAGWFDLDDLPEPLHPGSEQLFDEVDIDEALDDW